MKQKFSVLVLFITLFFINAHAEESAFSKPGFYGKISGGVSMGANSLNAAYYDKKHIKIRYTPLVWG